MKSFALLNLPMLTLCLGAALLLAPRCKAQSEVAPDHFDSPSTVPFEHANLAPANQTKDDHKPLPHQKVSARKTVAAHPHDRKSPATQAVQLTVAHDLSATSGQDAAVVPDKRKSATRDH